MGVTVKTSGRIEISIVAALDLAVSMAVGFVQRRSAKGITSSGTSMKPYSPLYGMQLRSVGENSNVDLTRSGSYLASIGERSRNVTATGASAVIGPDTGTSPSMPLPPPYVFSEKKTPEQRAEAFADWKAAPKKPGRSPPHNVLGAYLEHGTDTMPARPHLNLTADERKKIAAMIARVALKQGAR